MNAPPVLHAIARALGGEVSGGQVLAPGPGHNRCDRSPSIRLSSASPDGFLTHSFSGDDWRECGDHVRARLGLGRDGLKRERAPAPSLTQDEAERSKVAWFWRQRRPVEGTIAETYLRKARGYGGAFPPTLAICRHATVTTRH